jgi:nucleoside-diphosphate-sugar epimerase
MAPKVLLTGATGYVGKYLLAQILDTTDWSVVLPIRGKRGKTPQERFIHEFRNTTLFGTDALQQALQSRTTILECDVGNLQASHLTGVTMVVHNAANVSFFEKPEILYKDNVESMIHLTKLVNATESITRFIFISTCYIHPKDGRTKGQAVPLPPDLPQDSFINSYAYSKYLAEQELFRRSDLHPEVLRLSIVGAPIGPFSAHPCKGAAHLSILQALFQNRLTHLWIPNFVRLNIMPVDILTTAILDHMKQGVPEKPLVKQLCAPADSDSYNFSFQKLEEFFNKKYKHLLKDAVLSTVEDFQDFLAICKKAIRIPEYVDAIVKANRVLHSVEHNPHFESSFDASNLPPLTLEKHIVLTCDYVLRSIQEYNLKKGIPLTNSDKIIQLLDNPSLNAQIQVPDEIVSLPIQELKTRLYHALCTNRKLVAVLKEGVWVHGGTVSQGSVVLEIECESDEELYTWMQTHPIPLPIASRAILVKSTTGKRTQIVLQGNHVHMDGMGGMLQADAFSEILLGKLLPFQDAVAGRTPHELPLWEDILIGIRYLGWMVVDLAKQAFAFHVPSTKEPTMSAFATKEGEIPVRPGLTFTESYAKDLVESLGSSSSKDSVRLCIPANVASPFSRMKQPSCNHTALYYIDVPANQSESEFRESFKVFRSRAVKWMVLFLGAILSSVWPSLLKQCIHSVDLIYSNLHLPQFQNPIFPAVFMPLQKPQTAGCITITLNGKTTHTMVSNRVPAKQVQDSVQTLWKSRVNPATSEV